MSDVKIIELSAGYNIIARIVKRHEDGAIIIEDPLMISVKPGHDSLNIGVQPMLPFIDTEKQILINEYLLVASPTSDLVEVYESAFRTVQVPDKSIILPH